MYRRAILMAVLTSIQGHLVEVVGPLFEMSCRLNGVHSKAAMA